MKSYAQNSEDIFVQNYFGIDYKGTLLSIGENDGTTYSNARLLLENGFSGHLVEPAYVYHQLYSLYINRPDVRCYNLAIADAHGLVTLYESGAHVPNGTDRALVSSLSKAETERWSLAGVKFQAVKVNTLPFNSFWELAGFPQFDFITIDAEGYDWMILKQIDLRAIGCKCLVIEHNGNERLKTDFCEYCESFGLKPALVNRENIIFVK